MVKLEVEGEVGEDGMVHVATPELPVGAAVRVIVEEIGVPHPEASDLDRDLKRLRDDYDARRMGQPEFSAAYVELLERYDRENPDPLRKPKVLGRLKGKIEILPGFDDPIKGLEWAYP